MINIEEIVEEIIVEKNNKMDTMILGEIKQMAKDNGVFTTVELNEYAIVQALKKAIPIKPYKRDLWELGTAVGYTCPTCGYDFPVSYIEPCCCKCGQAIKRGD